MVGRSSDGAHRTRRGADFFDETTRLSRELTGALDRVGEVETASKGRSVTVLLDPRGSVVRIDIADGWRRECEPEGLGALVMATLSEAHAQRLGRWVEATAGVGAETQPRTTLPDPGDLVGGGSVGMGEVALADAVSSVGGLRGALDELFGTLTTAMLARHSAASSNKKVRATVNAHRELVGLEIDPGWADDAARGQVGEACTQAVQIAIATAPVLDSGRILAESRLGRLHQILTGQPMTAAPAPAGADARTDPHQESQ